MTRVPYALLSVLQDLLALYQRFGPSGPHRLELFHDQQPADHAWPAGVLREAPVLDELVRGVGCLLANSLAGAARPLVAELLSKTWALERELAGVAQAPEYYRYLTYELSMESLQPDQVCRLFGEVLAIYLDVLALARPELASLFGERVLELRRRIAQVGESSSGSATGLG